MGKAAPKVKEKRDPLKLVAPSKVETENEEEVKAVPQSKRQSKGLKKKQKQKEKKQKLLANIQQALEKKKGEKKKQKQGTNALALNTLNDLKDLLPPIEEGKFMQKTKLTSQRRKEILETENKQFSAVVNHPAYKANPLGAIAEHVQNAVKIMQQQQENQQQKEIEARRRDKKREKLIQKSKNETGKSKQSMDTK